MPENIICPGCSRGNPKSCPQSGAALSQIGYISGVREHSGEYSLNAGDIDVMISSLTEIREHCSNQGDLDDVIKKLEAAKKNIQG